MFSVYVNSVIDHPAMVGCHWFQYMDEPTTGRTFDGENYGIGFVSVVDTPYPEMVAAAREVHGGAYCAAVWQVAGAESQRAAASLKLNLGGCQLRLGRSGQAAAIKRGSPA